MATEVIAKDVSIVIPTYFREDVLVDTISALLSQEQRAGEILIVDQTPRHTAEVERRLSRWQEKGDIIWHRLPEPGIAGAMNFGLVRARGPIVLYLDDDIIPSKSLVALHASQYQDGKVCAVAGQVLQPGQKPVHDQTADRGRGIWRDLNYRFNSDIPGSVENCMAGNLSVRKDLAIAAGGMDENFCGVAHRFETEFAKRLIRHSGKCIKFDPAARIDHLQSPSGGTRTMGSHLRSASGDHSVGDFYYAYLQSSGVERAKYIAYRFFRSVRTRYHMRHPWWIPVKLLGEVRGFLQARELARLPQNLVVGPKRRE